MTCDGPPLPTSLSSAHDISPFSLGRLSGWRVESLGSVTSPDCPPVERDYVVSEDDDGTPLLQREGSVAFLTCVGTCRFRIDPVLRTVTIFDVSPKALDADLSHFLHDHVAPRILADQGYLVLHCSAVDMGGAIALFVGQTGAGKSTLGASLNRSGFPLLGDDAVIIEQVADGTHVGEPVYSSLRLFPEAIAALIGDNVETTIMAGYSDKRHVRLQSLAERSGTCLPVAGIFFLDGDAETAACRIDPVNPARACIALVGQSFSMDPTEPVCGARRLAACAALAEQLPAFELSYPRSFDRLPEVHELIRNALKNSKTHAISGAAS